MTIKALQSVCYHCSRLLCADPNNLEFKQAILIENPRDSFINIHNLCKKHKYCGGVQNIKKEEQESKS